MFCCRRFLTAVLAAKLALFMRKVLSVPVNSMTSLRHAACKPMWDLLGERKQLSRWFVKYKSKVVENSMLSSVQREAGLGDPPEGFTTNVCEPINAVVK